MRAVIFDLDGTLLDTLLDIARATNAALQACGFGPVDAEACRRAVGEGVRVLFRRLLPPGSGDEAVARCVRAFEAAYEECLAQTTRPYPGIPPMLDELTRRGYPLAILSNKPHHLTVKCVETFLARWRFQVIAGQRDGWPRKPDPAAALRVAQLMGVAPQHAVLVGDSAVDVVTAREAGMVPVGVAWGFGPWEELVERGARWILREPWDLVSLLEDLGAGGMCRR